MSSSAQEMLALAERLQQKLNHLLVKLQVQQNDLRLAAPVLIIMEFNSVKLYLFTQFSLVYFIFFNSPLLSKCLPVSSYSKSFALFLLFFFLFFSRMTPKLGNMRCVV